MVRSSLGGISGGGRDVGGGLSLGRAWGEGVGGASVFVAESLQLLYEY